jgi:nitroreductase
MQQGGAPSRGQLLEILADSMNVPSGDNTQPWRFRIEGSTVAVYNVEHGDPTLYNFRERGSYLAHGALAENISIAAAARGFSTRVEPFPSGPQCTARITFSASQTRDADLARALPNRTTNRKPYEDRSLAEDHRRALAAAIAPYSGVSLRLVEDKRSVTELAGAMSANEGLLMENRAMHDFLFGIIRWSKEEEERAAGLYVMTMEFPPPVRFLMRYVLRHWNAVRFLNLFGLSRAIPKQSAANYAASSAMGAVILRGERNEDFFTAGRALERLWLTATALGMSIQPVAALPYLLQRVRAGEAQAFSAMQQKIIEDANAAIASAFTLKGTEHIALLFRLGYGDAPTARSAKLPPRFVS